MANNDDQRPDDMPDFEADSDFSEFEDQKESEALGTTLRNNPLIKLGLVAAGLIVVIGGIVLFGGEDAKAPNSYVGNASPLKETPGTEELSPAMQEAMEEYNDQRTAEAIKQGTSVLPVPIQPPKTFLNAPADTKGEDPLQRWREMQEERLRVQREQEQMQIQQGQQAQQADPAAEQARAALASGMSGQMTEILTQGARSLAFMQVTAVEENKEAASTGMNTGMPPGMVMGADGRLIPNEPLEIVIPAGSILYAQLLNEANSDVEGPIVALLAQGAFSGSRVLGSFSVKEELLVLQFTTLISKEGFSVPITAYAMDPDTTLIGMATDVDRRYFKRIVLPAAAEFVTGMGSAIAERGTTRVTVNSALGGSTTTQDNTRIDTEQEISKGVERAFDKVGDILDQEGQSTKVLVVVKAGTPLGLLFMEPVTKQALDAAKYGSLRGGNAMNQPQQQPGNPLFTMMGMNENQQQMNNQLMGQGQYPNQYQNQYSNTGAMNALPQSIIQGLQNQQAIQSGTR